MQITGGDDGPVLSTTCHFRIFKYLDVCVSMCVSVYVLRWLPTQTDVFMQS